MYMHPKGVNQPKNKATVVLRGLGNKTVSIYHMIDTVNKNDPAMQQRIAFHDSFNTQVFSLIQYGRTLHTCCDGLAGRNGANASACGY